MRFQLSILIFCFACLSLLAAPTNSEVAAYGTAITNNGGTITLSDFNAIDAFVTAAKSHGYWTNITDCSPMAGDQTNASVIKLASHPASQLTNIQIINGGGYSPGKGFWLTNGAYLWPGLVLSNSVINETNNGACIWISCYPTNSRGWYYGGENAGTFQRNFVLGGLYFGAFSWQHYSGGDGTTGEMGTAGIANSEGMVAHSRISLSSAALFINGRMVTTGGTITPYGDGAQSGYPWCIGARKGGFPPLSGAPDSIKADMVIGFYAVDNGIPYASQTNYFNDVRALMAALGRAPAKASRRLALITTGQSNSIGGDGDTSQDTTWTPFDNLIGSASSVFGTGGADATNNFATRTHSFEYGAYTGWAAMADQISSMSTNAGLGATNDSIWQAFGKNGVNIGGYTYGTLSYQNSTNWASGQSSLEQDLCGDKLRFPAVVVVGGESDVGNASYGRNLYLMWQSYSNDLQTVSGDTNAMRLFFFQHSAFYNGSEASSVCPENLGMLTNHIQSGSMENLVGPRYAYSYSPTDAIHQDTMGNMRMGEMAGYAIFRTLTNGYWEPLRPLSVVLSASNQISCTFTGLYSRLVLDTNSFWWLTNKANYGFYYSDSAASAISSVALQSTNQVLLTLNADVTSHTSRRVNYAVNNTTNVVACGTQWGPGGNLRDDCPVTGFRSTSNLWNWSVIFAENVTTNNSPTTNSGTGGAGMSIRVGAARIGHMTIR